MMADVICVGLLLLMQWPVLLLEIPDKGKLSLVDDLQLHTGGCAANTGAALAKLGFPQL